MSDYFTVLDEKGNRVTVGSLVNTSAELENEQMPQAKRIEEAKRWNLTPEQRARHEAETYVRAADGLVIEITDFDGDVDDDTGRSIQINPKVKVRWQDGTEEAFGTCVSAHGAGYGSEPYFELEVTDLIVLNPGDEPMAA